MSFPRMSNFVSAWLNLSNGAKVIWKDRFIGKRMEGYSETR